MELLFVILCVAIIYHIIFSEIRERARGVLLAKILVALNTAIDEMKEVEERNAGTRENFEISTRELKRIGKFVGALEDQERERAERDRIHDY